MANNTISIPKGHLIMGLCLPLAVLLGYFLAEPMESGSVAVVALVLGVLAVPLLMRWHYPMLVVSWNAAINPIVLPGRAHLWVLLAAIGLLFAMLNRAVNSNSRFVIVPAINKPLIFLMGVVLVTAMLTGGIGLRSMGSNTYGGKKYFYLLAAVAGYFALTSRRIPVNRAGLYAALFFLSGTTAVIGNIAYTLGPKFSFLLDVFSPESAADQAAASLSLDRQLVRISGLSWVSPAIYSFMLARYGIRGVLDLSRPWRLLFFMASLFIGLFGGFRSVLVMFGLTFAVLFLVEGLHRTKYLPILAGMSLLGVVVCLPLVSKLPLAAQRTLAFLPIKVDPLAKLSAEASSEWRLEMWRIVLPQVPEYFFHGKGYSLDAGEVYMAQQNAARKFVDEGSGAALTMDFHNGPLSLLIPFGIYGAIGFTWFLIAGLRVLYRNYKYGAPELRNINAMLLAIFAARVVMFYLVFGSLYSDMALFLGWLGLGVALNGPDPARDVAASEAEELAFHPEYSEA
jgi:hypothetical protein